MTREELAQYIKSELANDDTEIYLDIDDYKIIVKALEQESIVDKIRAEIKPYTDPKGFIVIGENRFNMILDRCKAESEEI